MNKQYYKKQSYGSKSDEQGSALITLLVFATIVAFAAAGIASISGQHQHMTRIIVDRTGAQQIAEGAASRVLVHIANDSQNIAQPPTAVMTGEMGSGTYEVDIINSETDVLTIEATGMVNDQSRTVKVHIRPPRDFPGRNNAMFSNGDIKLGGTGNIESGGADGGDIHANQSIEMKGNTGISGDAVAVGDVDAKSSAVGGAIYPGAAPISFPQIDLDEYYEIAEIHEDDLHLQGDHAPSSGVLWVVGDVHISSHVNFTGLLVATGDIHQAGHYTHHRTAENPPVAMISRDGDIKLSGQTDIDDSLIYAKSGQVEIVGGSGFRGAIAAWGDIHARGNWDIVDYIEDAWGAIPQEDLRVLAWEF